MLRCSECLLLTNYESWSHGLPLGDADSNCLAMECMQVARSNPAYASDHRYFYAIGGENEEGEILTSCEQFRTDANKWRYLSEVPEPLISPAAALCNGQLYVSGGTESANLYVLNLEVENSPWRLRSDLIVPRCEFCCLFIFNDCFFLV